MDKDIGLRYERTKYNPKEKAFADAWKEECKPVHWLNYGHGLIQDLFMTYQDGDLYRPVMLKELTDDERMVAATCIQWLGSNCGWAFLEKVVEDCGYKIVKQEKK